MGELSNVNTVAHVIQLSVAPVFLLSGIGAILAVMASRSWEPTSQQFLKDHRGSAEGGPRNDGLDPRAPRGAALVRHGGL